MPKPTIVQLFGTAAQVATSSTTVSATASDPALIIRFSDFASVNWNTVAGTTNAERWLSALLLRARSFHAGNNDELPGVVVDAPFPGLTTRNNALMREYAYTVRIFEPDTGAAQPDPDNV